MRCILVVVYFVSWFALSAVAVVLNVKNYDWLNSSHMSGYVIVMIFAILESSVAELIVMAVVAMIAKVIPERSISATPWHHLTLVMNYNLLALSVPDIDETFQTMYEAYMNNLGPNVSLVLVSATVREQLREHELVMRDRFRSLIQDTLRLEGRRFADGQWELVDKSRLELIWKRFSRTDTHVFLRQYLPEVCHHYAREFMVVHRVHRVLKKCGQYQDLMQLSHGDPVAFTYTDRTLYGELARPYGQPLFTPSEDVANIRGRNFDYTLVLDCDTRVLAGIASRLMSVAADHPGRALIQPAIRLHVLPTDSMFMRIEALRQDVAEPYMRVVSRLLGQSGYYGKALIKNEIYLSEIVGTRDTPLERVPIDVLSHDTFEASILRPIYAPNVFLYETPCYNYITWDARESRWNRGEILLSVYFWPTWGGVMRLLQRCFQGGRNTIPRLRTPVRLDFVSAYIAYSPLRQMLMKPFLILFIIVHVNVRLHYYWVPFLVVMFFVAVFPKLAVITFDNWKAVFIEIITALIQFTPEAMVGTYRMMKALEANICSCCPSWKPQRALEEELRRCNPFRSSFRHLWSCSAISLGAMLLVFPYSNHLYLFLLLVSVFILPFYCGFTSYNTELRSLRCYEVAREKANRRYTAPVFNVKRNWNDHVHV